MKRSFPWMALGIGLLLALVLLQFSPLDPDGRPAMPLLTALLMSEFGFLLTAAGAIVSGREVLRRGARGRDMLLLPGNLLLAASFVRLGLALWAQTSG
ncbi:MAG TPA: hypothetical protein EYP40_01125 [Chromatiales bacterium]|nr:hypothetical protein [Chromatiales bacterium]